MSVYLRSCDLVKPGSLSTELILASDPIICSEDLMAGPISWQAKICKKCYT